MNYFRHLYVSPELILRFIDTFARFEFALKRTGFAVGNNNRVDADWLTFSRSIHEQFNPGRTPELNTAVNYLLSRHPRKQVLLEGKLNWKEVPPDANLSNAENLQFIIRRVRNNLFHGGKFLVGGASEPGRDEDLIRYCLIVLEEFLSLHARVREVYEM